jgi:hypothetical protein
MGNRRMKTPLICDPHRNKIPVTIWLTKPQAKLLDSSEASHGCGCREVGVLKSLTDRGASVRGQIRGEIFEAECD